MILVFLLSASAADYNSDHGLEPLHRNVHVACSSCESLIRILIRAIQSPNPQLSGQTIQEIDPAGTRKKVPYTQSVSYVNDLFDILCNSPALRQLRIRKGWFGMPKYVYDDVPVYHRSIPSGDKNLLSACNIIAGTQHRTILAPSLAALARAKSQIEIEAVVCSQVLQPCVYRLTLMSMLEALLYSSALQDLTVLLRLLPLFVIVTLLIACIWPASLYSRFRGTFKGPLTMQSMVRRSMKKYS